MRAGGEIEAEDGRLWIYGVGEDGVMALTDFGIETLIERVGIYKEIPNCSDCDPMRGGYSLSRRCRRAARFSASAFLNDAA
jgi:hypothetical protein